MGRRDPESERRRRAEDELGKALKRGDLELALASLEKLRQSASPEAVAQVGAGLRRAVGEAHRMSQWARLHALAVRAGKIPGLVDAGAAPGDADACRWALLWGCVRGRDAARARALLEPLAPRLAASPALARCVAGFVDAEGELPDEVVAALPASLRRGPDPRLGREPPAARAEPPPPLTADGARASVLLAAHRLPAAALGDWLQHRIEQAPPDVAAALRASASPVARRELLRRFRDGAPLGPAVRVLCAALPPAPRAAQELALLLEAMRLAASRGAPRLDLEKDPDGVALLARALLAEPAFGILGARWLVDAAGAAPAGPGRDRLLGQALAANPTDFALWASVSLKVIDLDDDRAPPSWLSAALERAAADAAALARGWAAIPPRDTGAVIERLGCLPLPLGLRLVEQSWPGAPPELRRHLCALVGDLSDAGLGGYDLDALGLGDLDASERRLATRLLARNLAAPMRGLWTRLGGELLDVNPHLLPFAIQAAGPSLAEQRQFLTAWLDGRKLVEDWLAALNDVALVPRHDQELCDLVFNRLLERFGRDADALGKALLDLHDCAPAPAARRLAEALIEAAPRRAQERAQGVREALALARRLVKGQRIGRGRRQAGGQAGEPPRPKRRRRPRAEQMTLDIDDGLPADERPS